MREFDKKGERESSEKVRREEKTSTTRFRKGELEDGNIVVEWKRVRMK